MPIYYYKQLDRQTGELLGLISYNGVQPSNDNEQILLVEISEEEFFAEIAATEEGGEEDELFNG